MNQILKYPPPRFLEKLTRIPYFLLLLLALSSISACKKESLSEVKPIEVSVEEAASDRTSTTNITGIVGTATNSKKYVYRTNIAPFLKTGGAFFGQQVCSKAFNQNFVQGTYTLNWKMTTGNVDFFFSTSPSTQLATVIGSGGQTPTLQAHHIIPVQLCNAFNTSTGTTSYLHAVIKKAALNGFHPNEGYNGIGLTSSVHSGSHPDYTRWVENQLNNYINPNIGNKQNASEAETNKWVQCKLIPQALVYINKAKAANITIQTYFLNNYTSTANASTRIVDMTDFSTP